MTSPHPHAADVEQPRVDHLRPRAHFTARDTWLNDPNGLLHHDGVYHLFFQNNPHGSSWGNVSWGHATSADLTTWTEQPVAILADEHEEVFSGSAVVDRHNTAGFASPGETALVAIYTSSFTQASSRPGVQAQSLAYSVDGGVTWQRYGGNPVLDVQRSDFRDPKVFWHGGEDGRWIMVAVEAVERQVVVHSSPDLKRWSFESRFGPAHAVGGVWECPDLFTVPVRGSDERLWVLVVSLNPGGVSGGSGTQYFVGRFDGRTFTPDRLSGSDDPRDHDWLDHGHDYYAAVSFHAAPGDRRLTMAWASSWDYADDTPTHPWRSALTLARELELVRRPDGRTGLAQRPVLPADRSTCTIAELQVPTGPGRGHEVRISDDSGECEVLLTFDGDARTMSCDRRRSGNTGFHPSFLAVDVAPLLGGPVTDVLIVVDGCVLEVYLDRGLSTLTQLVFPHRPLTNVSVSSTERP